MQDEKDALDAKIATMDAYFETAEFAALPIEERVRQNDQRIAMRRYSQVLGQRIAAALESAN